MSVVHSASTKNEDIPLPSQEIDWSRLSVVVDSLTFTYFPQKQEPILHNVSMRLNRGSRCLLVGSNGAGKSTLLRVLAGKRLQKEKVFVLGKNAFFESPTGVAYLGTEWAMNPVVHRDVPVWRLLNSMGADNFPQRTAKLVHLLDVNPNWHMHQVSDGQRRRVQIVMGLLKPFELLLLDEVTVDLDVVAREALLKYLVDESQHRNATIVYATHIFDGLGTWPTNLIHLRQGEIAHSRSFSDEKFPELDEQRLQASAGKISDNSLLLNVVSNWLQEDLAIYKSECKSAGASVHLEIPAALVEGRELESAYSRPISDWEKILETLQYE